MNLADIPTPETDAVHARKMGPAALFEMTEHARDLERRLTVAREALMVVANCSSSTRLLRISREALTQTAPK